MWWFLAPLWLLSGLLGWAWANYVIDGANPGVPDPPDKWWALLGGLIIGPFCILIAAAFIVVTYPREHRWGLRFR